ncbi:Short chain dehydrogenase [plant metagenome]|uniref:Short chain dehydrogenase n=1 Tax=plant metagenome TaxID=1297885 RepID=A0A484QQ46_9ZZZZ
MHILIAGASRGIGLALADRYLAQGHHVLALARQPEQSEGLAALARRYPGTLRTLAADITDRDVAERLLAVQGDALLDRVIVNAGISQPTLDSLYDLSDADAARLFVTNAVAPLRLARSLAPRVVKGGAVAFLSSQMGSVELALSARIPLYGASKAALNSLMRNWWAEEDKALPFALLALHPGWVRTDMGGSGADLSVDESADGLVTTIEHHAQAGSDCVFVDYRNETLAW